MSAFEIWHLLSCISGQLASYPLGLPRAPAGIFYLSGLTTWRTGSAGSQATKLQESAGHKLANQPNLLLGSWLKLPWEEEESELLLRDLLQGKLMMSLCVVNSPDPKEEEHILGIVVTLRMCKHAGILGSINHYSHDKAGLTHPDVFTIMKITNIAVVLLWIPFCGGLRKGQSLGEALSISDLFNAHLVHREAV